MVFIPGTMGLVFTTVKRNILLLLMMRVRVDTDR
jgi:hypothetical protein